MPWRCGCVLGVTDVPPGVGRGGALASTTIAPAEEALVLLQHMAAHVLKTEAKSTGYDVTTSEG